MRQVLYVTDFRNATGLSRHDWLGFAFAETLSGLLDSLADTLVQDRLYMTGPFSMKVLQEEFEIELLVHGAVRRARNKLSFSVEVLDLGKRKPVGTARVSGSLSQLFDLQEQMAIKVAALLKVRVSKEERGHLRDRPTKSIPAYRALTEAWQAERKEDRDTARERAHRAMRADPRYEEAYDFLRSILWEEGSLSEMMETDRRMTASRPELAYLHRNLSESYAAQNMMEEAIAAAKRALAMDEEDPSSRLHMAHLFSLQGNYEAVLQQFEAMTDGDFDWTEDFLDSLVTRTSLQSPATWTASWTPLESMQLLAGNENDLEAVVGVKMLEPFLERHVLFSLSSANVKLPIPEKLAASLRDERGREFRSAPVGKGLQKLLEGSELDGTRFVAFHAKDTSGNRIITPDTQRLTLVVSESGGHHERAFTWTKPAGCLRAIRQLQANAKASLDNDDPESQTTRTFVETVGAVARFDLEHDPPLCAFWVTPEFFAAAIIMEGILEGHGDHFPPAWNPMRRFLEGNQIFVVFSLDDAEGDETAKTKAREALDKWAAEARVRNDQGQELAPTSSSFWAAMLELGMKQAFPEQEQFTAKLLVFPKIDDAGNPVLGKDTKTISLTAGDGVQEFSWPLPLKYPARLNDWLQALNEGKLPMVRPKSEPRRKA